MFMMRAMVNVKTMKNLALTTDTRKESRTVFQKAKFIAPVQCVEKRRRKEDGNTLMKSI